MSSCSSSGAVASTAEHRFWTAPPWVQGSAPRLCCCWGPSPVLTGPAVCRQMQGCGRPAASAALGLCPRGAAGCGPAAPGTLPFGPSPPRLAHLTCVRWPCLARLPAAGLTVSPQAAGPASAHCCLWLERCKAAWGLSTSFSTIMLTGAMCGADSSPVPPLPVQTARQACCHGRAPTPSVPRRACGPAEPWDGPGPPLPFCCAQCHCQAPQGSARCPSQGPPGGSKP